MSGLLATFPCPWCGMSYPAKPVLVGKAVRCKGCRNAFVLQPEGHAIKVEDPPATPAAAPPPPPPSAVVAQIEPISVAVPAPQPKPSAPAPVPVPRPKPAPVSTVSPPSDVLVLGDESAAVVEVLPQAKTQTPPPAKSSERIPKRKTEHLEAARAQMAAQLAEVAAKAANTEAAKREEKKSERIARTGGATAVTSSSKPASRKAVLSGQGEQHHREMVRMWAGIGIAAAVVLLLIFVFSLRSTVREGLDFYASPVPNEQNRYPVLGDALRSRAWLVSAPSMPGGPMLATDLSDASLAAERPIDLEPMRPVLADLKDLRHDPTLDIWVAPKDLERARTAVGERRGAEALTGLVAARIRHVPHRTVTERLALPPEDLALLLDLLSGTASQTGEPFAKRMLDLGEVPARLVLRQFTGRKGSLLQDIGRPPYRPVQAAYTGTLMRIEGERWPIGWRVLYLSQVK